MLNQPIDGWFSLPPFFSLTCLCSVITCLSHDSVLRILCFLCYNHGKADHRKQGNSGRDIINFSHSFSSINFMPAIQQEVKSVSHNKLESFLDRVRSPVGTLDTPLVLDILCLLDQSYRTHHLQSLFQRYLPFYKPQRLPSNPLRQSAHQYKCNQNDICQLMSNIYTRDFLLC